MNATPAPQNLVVTKQNKRDAEFAWEAVQSPKLAHYSIYVNGKKNNKVANKTTIALSGFQPGKHSIYVTATYKNGDVSGVSNVVTITIEGNTNTSITSYPYSQNQNSVESGQMEKELLVREAFKSINFESMYTNFKKIIWNMMKIKFFK
ncbi:DUF4397 domain-containing protein [Paenibacillus agilis]|uniref:DUF4397 domain-containing protein n=2 Tax=Paenibacillus agilis TaxID=3020863 RepID=A0A559J157_9BACL|nr:DUF4397 domain-containing protein [Paenibacillus agilis]